MIFVCVPRDVFPKYCDMGWSEMLATARDGVDGLTIIDDPTFKDGTVQGRTGFATFRDGTGRGSRTPNIASLHHQGW